jgi:uroporphyrinogen III methyltransferase / synthase
MKTATSKSLDGRTVVVTRAESQAGEFVSELEKYGAKVLVCPSIEITDPESYGRLDEALNDLFGYDWLIFTSVNGVDYFLRRAETRNIAVSELDGLRVCAIGEATAEHLRQAMIHVDVVPAEFKAEGVFTALEQFVGGRDALRGVNFLIPRAAVARDYLPKALEAAGARVDVVPAYRTVVPSDVDRGRLAATLAGGADCIAFTSSSTVRNLASLFDTLDLDAVLAGTTVACIGDITAATAVEYGLTPQVQPKEFTIPALAAAIAEYFAATTETQRTQRRHRE